MGREPGRGAGVNRVPGLDASERNKSDLATVAPVPDRDPDELLAMVIEAVAENLPDDDAEVIELPVEDEGLITNEEFDAKRRELLEEL